MPAIIFGQAMQNVVYLVGHFMGQNHGQHFGGMLGHEFHAPVNPILLNLATGGRSRETIIGNDDRTVNPDESRINLAVRHPDLIGLDVDCFKCAVHTLDCTGKTVVF